MKSRTPGIKEEDKLFKVGPEDRKKFPQPLLEDRSKKPSETEKAGIRTRTNRENKIRGRFGGKDNYWNRNLA